jgi:pantoate kinase
MSPARAFAPGHISCVFKAVPHDDPARMHSVGFGFTVRDGVEVTVSRASRASIRFNGRAIEFPTVRSVAGALTPQLLRIEIDSPLPLGAGFGLSGASALATAYAVNTLLGGARSDEQLAMVAHVAEVTHLTGLGDVCGQYHGGCRARLTPGEPLSAPPIRVAERPIYYRYFESIHTRDVLADPARLAGINGAADRALEALAGLTRSASVDLEVCVGIAREFAVKSGLLSHPGVRHAIAEIEAAGGAASMIMLGHSVFGTQDFAGAQQTRLSWRRAAVLQ